MGTSLRGSSGEGRDLLHLLFADNTLIFCKANSDHLRYLSWVFLWFGAIFGLKVNRDKSEAIPIGRIESLEDVVSVMGCRVVKLPTFYLGPFGCLFQIFKGVGCSEGEIQEKIVFMEETIPL